jgi:hypothetical protein
VYIAGKLVFRPDSITIYIVYNHQKLSSDISALLQLQRTLAFSLGFLDFLLVPECSIPGKIIHYVIRYGVEVRALKIVCIQSTKPCDPRSNMDLACYIWATFDYYCANYAVIVLLPHTSGDKIVYVRSYQAEIGGETSRHCGQCVCITKNPRAYFNFGCIAPQTCTCALCCKSPSSLKPLASVIVFDLYNKQKSCFDNVTTCTPLQILEISEDALLHMIFS